MIEKGLLDWKGFEPTNPASTIVGRGRFGLAAPANLGTTNNLKNRGLDMAGSTPCVKVLKF